MKDILILFGLCVVLACSFLLYSMAKTQSTYEGLPTVPCLDYKKPIVKQFTVTIDITVSGKLFPLDTTIGHDYGNCLHDIFVNDLSGKIYIESNDKEVFTLGQFFDVWHKTFSPTQIFNYQVANTHRLRVLVNNTSVNTYRQTVLKPNEHIEVIYD